MRYYLDDISRYYLDINVFRWYFILSFALFHNYILSLLCLPVTIPPLDWLNQKIYYCITYMKKPCQNYLIIQHFSVIFTYLCPIFRSITAAVPWAAFNLAWLCGLCEKFAASFATGWNWLLREISHWSSILSLFL